MPRNAPTAEPALGRRDGAALAAAALFAVDPLGLGGVRLRSSAGPHRDAWLAGLRMLLPAATPWRRLPAHATDERLLGGLDLAATLAAGRPVAQRGLLAQAHGGIVVAAMAERMPTVVAARLAAVLDRGEVQAQRDGLDFSSPARVALIALDEGLDADEALPAALLDRLGLHVDLDGPPMPPPPADWSAQDVAAARLMLPRVRCEDALLEACVAAAVAYGVASSRAPWYVLRVSCCAAALAGREHVNADDCSLAVQWVLAPRATQAPAQAARGSAAEPAPAPPTPPTPTSQHAPPPPPPASGPEAEPETATASDREQSAPDAAFDERLIDAVRAAIPPGLLAAMQAGPLRDRRAASAGRAGAQTAARQRGRPVGARRGEPRGGARLNLIETLRAAAPWQRVRRAAQAGAAAPAAPSGAAAPAAPSGAAAPATPSSAAAPATPSSAAAPATLRVLVRREDLRVTRYVQRRATTTLFVIDASGSAALQRLAEAKGAVEQLLADCYARRDQVAVLGFRGTTAQILLPPTRSLVRARRSLAGLPGGGGTPLAAGLDAALNLAQAVRRGGATPLLVLLTDGRANIARDGRPGRDRAQIDAMQAARSLAGLGCASLLVDTSAQPSPHAQRLALAMNARYLALPRATADMLSAAMRAQRR